MCRQCNGTGVIVYGADTESGRREVICECRRGYPQPPPDCADCCLVGDIKMCLSEPGPCGQVRCRT